MSNLWWVKFISVLVVAAVVYFVIRKIEKDSKARHNAKTSKPTSSIDKSEIDINGLYLNKMEIVNKKKVSWGATENKRWQWNRDLSLRDEK